MMRVLLMKIQNKNMQKRQNLKKGKRYTRVEECLICRIARVPFLITVSSVILLQKYYYPPQKLTLVALTHPLIKHIPGRIRTNYHEAQFMSDHRESLLGYLNFQSIIAKIKPVVLECLRRDQPLPMHYEEKAHRIMIRHSLQRRRVTPTTNLRLTKQNHNESTDQDQNSDPRMEPLPKGNQTASMRRLTRNLSSMVRRFQDHNDFHSSFILELMNYASKHTVESVGSGDGVWRKELDDNSISQILKTQKTGNERLVTNPQPSRKLEFYENYGFKQKIMNDQYKTERRKIVSPNLAKPMKENIPYRVQTDYDCEAIKKGKKKSSVSSKKDLEKGRKFQNSTSKKKDGCKLGSVAKSRVKGF